MEKHSLTEQFYNYSFKKQIIADIHWLTHKPHFYITCLTTNKATHRSKDVSHPETSSSDAIAFFIQQDLCQK